jgi:hypothetical protein
VKGTERERGEGRNVDGISEGEGEMRRVEF